MKRRILFLIVLACFTALAFGQRRPRTTIQKIIQLTKPATSGGKSFQEALASMRPVSGFTGQPLDKNQVGQLAWAGLGNRISPDLIPPTPGPLESPFPTQIYVVSNDGVFFYQPINHSLEQLVEGDARFTLATATSIPDAVSNSGCVMIITSSIPSNSSSRRSMPTSAKNAMLLEAGHIAQNIQLQAACLNGLGSVTISEFDDSGISKICNLPRGTDVLYMVCVGYLAEQQTSNNGNASAVQKRAAIIVPSVDFQDEEFWQTKNILESAKILVTVVSNQLGPVKGLNGTLFDVPRLANDIRAADYDAVIVIGGPGAAMFFNDNFVLNVIQDAFQRRKIIGATSRGTLVLANAGILNGVQVTGIIEESAAIQNAGAVFTNMPVEKDMLIITGAGPQSAMTFATAMADSILGK